MRIFIALLIYISIVSTSNIRSFQAIGRNTTYKLIKFITLYQFQQIKRYFHILLPLITISLTCLPLLYQHLKLEPLASMLYTTFQTYVILSQNISFDKMMVLFSRRSKHILKIKNKPISEGFKIWALCDHGYLQDFLFYSCTTSKLYIYSYNNYIQTNI